MKVVDVLSSRVYNNGEQIIAQVSFILMTSKFWKDCDTVLMQNDTEQYDSVLRCM